MGKLLEKLQRSNIPMLQLAIDFTRLEDAFILSRKLSNLPIPIIEIGTPMIKAEGIRAVSILKAFWGGDALILADTKTADVGALEVDLISDAGGDASTILASSDDEVISSAMREAVKKGIDIVVDTIGVRDLVKRIEELMNLGVKIINVHTGIDVQHIRGVTASSSADLIKTLTKKYSNVYFSISGGIRLKDIEKIVQSEPSIVVVGSAITKSPNPARDACLFLKKLGEEISC